MHFFFHLTCILKTYKTKYQKISEHILIASFRSWQETKRHKIFKNETENWWFTSDTHDRISCIVCELIFWISFSQMASHRNSERQRNISGIKQQQNEKIWCTMDMIVLHGTTMRWRTQTHRNTMCVVHTKPFSCKLKLILKIYSY